MWRSRCSSSFKFSAISTLLCSFLLLSCYPGFILTADVTLQSIEIFNSHEWLKTKPTVYFCCKGENRTVLPDVKETNFTYNFKGEESWQPLTELLNKKCKRCGFYEEDFVKIDHTFDEWELCPDDFGASNGKFTHAKDGELTATMSCSACQTLTGGDAHVKAPKDNGGPTTPIVIITVVCVAAVILIIVCLVMICKYCQKKKRLQEQARFMKLFEEGDDMEDELGLGDTL